MKPSSVIDYNAAKKGVDVSDQMSAKNKPSASKINLRSVRQTEIVLKSHKEIAMPLDGECLLKDSFD
ncbi:hypothetical protein J437_LFUL011472, partial [Ladona fulva]